MPNGHSESCSGFKDCELFQKYNLSIDQNLQGFRRCDGYSEIRKTTHFIRKEGELIINIAEDDSEITSTGISEKLKMIGVHLSARTVR